MPKILILEDDTQESNILLKFLTAFPPPYSATPDGETNNSTGTAPESISGEIIFYQGAIATRIPLTLIDGKLQPTLGKQQIQSRDTVAVGSAEVRDLPLDAGNSDRLEPEFPARGETDPDRASWLAADALLDRVFELIHSDYARSITLCDVARAVGYSATYLTDLVRRKTGKTVNHWIIERRMQAARELLLTTNQNAYQIALAIGYQNESHFFRQFRQYHDTTPQNWRKLQREQTPRKM